MSIIDFKTLDVFNTERIKILIEKYPRYEHTWENIDFLELKHRLLKCVNTLGLTSDKTPRKLLHIANYCYFLYTRLINENIGIS